jgi:RNA polymerase sigma factor (sigma-70 family)
VAQKPIGVSGRYLRALFDVGVASDLADGQLLERFANDRGEVAEVAFATLVERHGSMVLRACLAILRDEHEAMDAFQATFLVLVRKGRSLWIRDSLGPWLHRVACRAAVRAKTAGRRRLEIEQRAAEAIANRVRPPDRHDDLAAVIHEEVDRLPERYRAPIVLCDLEGRTCEQAARHLGCPIGTIGSRLTRGRERLRSRLARRGVAPAAVAATVASCAEADAAPLSTPLVDATVQAAAGHPSAAGAALANMVLRSMIMARYRTFAAAIVAVCAASAIPAWAPRPTVGGHAQEANPKPAAKKKLTDLYPIMNDRSRAQGARYLEIGNMRPLIKDELGVRFQSRLAILYKDGTAKLWSAEQKDPVAPTLRQKGPIQGLTFFNEASLLITVSDESVGIWDGLTGKPRNEIDKQFISPLWLSFAPGAQRFVTIDLDRTAVTVWNANTLTPVSTFKPPRIAPRLSAGLSGDGRTVATFTYGTDAAVELWDVASGRSFATLRAPSRVLASVFTNGGADLDKPRLTPSVGVHQGPLWDLVQSLAPAPQAGATGH